MADRNLLSLLGRAVLLGTGVTSSATPPLDTKGQKAVVGAGGCVLGIAISNTAASGDDLKLQHSNDNSTWADVPAKNVNWSLSNSTKAFRKTNLIELDKEAASGTKVALAQYDGGRRYVRFHVGSVATGEVALVFALLRRKYRADDISRS